MKSLSNVIKAAQFRAEQAEKKEVQQTIQDIKADGLSFPA